MQEGQQEGPEGHDEDAHHRIAHQGQDAHGGHDAHGNPHVSAVRDAHLRAVADVGGGLPDDEQQQEGREDERHDAGRQEDGPHQDAQEHQQQGGGVDVPGGFGLVAPDPDQERDEDGEREPGELGEQRVGHPPVGIAPVGPDEQHAQDEEEDGQDG